MCMLAETNRRCLSVVWTQLYRWTVYYILAFDRLLRRNGSNRFNTHIHTHTHCVCVFVCGVVATVVIGKETLGFCGKSAASSSCVSPACRPGGKYSARFNSAIFFFSSSPKVSWWRGLCGWSWDCWSSASGGSGLKHH